MAGDRTLSQRGNKYQHYAAVLCRALPRGGGGIPPRARDSRGTGTANRQNRVGRVVVRESRRHRGRRTHSSAWRLSDGPTRQGRPRKRTPCLCQLPGDVTQQSLAGFAGEGRQTATTALG